MKSFISLVYAIDFIERSLRSRITPADAAEAAYLSLSRLQSMFAHVLGVGVAEYIAKRRLCVAARDLLETERSVTDIAFAFGYANVESFSRAFKKQFLCTPSVYRREHRFTELYPKLLVHEKRGFDGMERYDITETGGKILASKNTYIITTDIDHMLAINENIGRAAGDAAIAAFAARIGRSVRDGMDFFRISGDSFVVLTGQEEPEAAEEVAKQILSYADEDVVWSGGAFKFTVSLGIAKIPPDAADAKAAIERSDEAMMAAKRNGRNTYAVL